MPTVKFSPLEVYIPVQILQTYWHFQLKQQPWRDLFSQMEMIKRIRYQSAHENLTHLILITIPFTINEVSFDEFHEYFQ